MWISISLLLAFGSVFVAVADKIDGCQILQTTDPRTPCYILIKQAPSGVPPFVYMLNLPRSTPQMPCPVSQTLDESYSCYVPPATADDPAFILNVPLPPGADEIDDSPAGKAKLREAKANPIFRKTGSTLGLGQGQQGGLSQKIGPFQQFGQSGQFRQPQTLGSPLPQYQRLAQPIGQTRPIGQIQQQTGLTQPIYTSSFDLSKSAGLPQPIGQTRTIGPIQQPPGLSQPIYASSFDFSKSTSLPRTIGQIQPIGQTVQPTGLSNPIYTSSFRFSKSTGLPEPLELTQPIGQTRPIGQTQQQTAGLSQPIYTSSFDLSKSTRLPQPIGLTQPIGQTRPIGPPSPQLTKALFKPLSPSLPQIQPPPPPPQPQFIFRTLPTLFQPQLTQTTPNAPRTHYHIVEYQNQQPLYYTSFTQSTEKGSFPYPSAEGSGSISAFEGPYPPKYEY